MNKLLFSFICVALAVLAGAALSSCNKDDVIETEVAPEIILDSETGIYTVAAGEELTISPFYKNVEGASFKWTLDGRILALTPDFTYTWAEPGEYFVSITVTTKAGTTSEEVAVNVIKPAIPAISFPISNDRLQLAVGTEYLFAPELINIGEAQSEIVWTLDGKMVGDESTYLFNASECGSYVIGITVSNTYGSASKSISIDVVESLPGELRFPPPSYFSTSTTRYTFVDRPVFLTPIWENISPVAFAWSVNGAAVDCNVATFEFTPEQPGEYLVSVSVDGGSATAAVKVMCVSATESELYRAPSATSSPYSTKVFEWVPAPGQFIGETVVGGMTGNETTLELANKWAEQRLSSNYYVSLGGFGGYIIVGFDHSIAKKDGQYDFSIMGNAFLNAQSGAGGSNEPGIVYVMQDVNGNGLPDDEWYELRGSDTGLGTTLQCYAVTYYRPSAPQMSVQWTDNAGATGSIDYLSAFHRQDYYYPAWIEADSYTLRGTRLADRTTQNPDTGLWDNSAFDWGYSDNMGSDNMAGADAVTGEGQRNGFLIENAMYPNLTHINLQYIDFIKVQTGVNAKAGWLGEVSTEVFGFEDLNIK
ncbi:MAG: cell surface protein [Muribaculaceae bacterium]|nr:cell surface protein [Muribaculaceae bacterium]